MAKKKSQPQSAIPFFMMAVFAYLAGFPVWLSVILALVGLLVLKIEKDKKALDKLPPLPPAESSATQTTQTTQGTGSPFPLPLPEPFGQKAPEPAAQAPTPSGIDPYVPDPPTYREPIEVPKPAPWASPDYVPYPAPQPTAPRGSEPADANDRLSSMPSTKAGEASIGRARTLRTDRIVASLRSRSSARQAIVAMTVLGQPRALQPYEFDPIQQPDVAPGRPS